MIPCMVCDSLPSKKADYMACDLSHVVRFVTCYVIRYMGRRHIKR